MSRVVPSGRDRYASSGFFERQAITRAMIQRTIVQLVPRAASTGRIARAMRTVRPEAEYS